VISRVFGSGTVPGPERLTNSLSVRPSSWTDATIIRSHLVGNGVRPGGRRSAPTLTGFSGTVPGPGIVNVHV
jgi:hypothetical protein